MSRTLDQLVTLTAENLAAHQANVQVARAQEAETLAVLEAARTQEQEALKSGNEAAFTKAKQDVAYNRSRYDYIMQVSDTPFYTKDQFAALVKELSNATGTETKALYEQLHTAFLSCVSIVNSIEAVYAKRNEANAQLLAAIPYNHRGNCTTEDGAYYVPVNLAVSINSEILNAFEHNSLLEQNIKDAVQFAQNQIDA